jgi:glycosyltransferase involved in cell wall biosynthesis
MRILILADPAAAHTIKWVNSLKARGIDIYLFGLGDYNPGDFINDINIETLGVSEKVRDRSDGAFSKVIYLLAIKKIKKIISQYKPNILHSHYASSFGLLGALTGFHPYIISVWGSDISTFPSSLFRSRLLKFVLSRADQILSTSRAMREQTKTFTEKEILLTPFGIDTEKFSPKKVTRPFGENDLVIGTVKTLKEYYGIEFLIEAFHILKNKYPSERLKLLIVGGGDKMEYLKNLVLELGINADTFFTGYIRPDKVVDYHNMLDIYVAPSVRESFGVAVLEASSCCKPVVVSNVGGLPEVVDDEKTGFIVQRENPTRLAEAIEKLILNEQLRILFGENGRNKVIKEYNWTTSVDKMINIYESCLNYRIFNY